MTESREQWRPIGLMPYEASTEGRIRRIGRARPMRQSAVHGYLKVSLTIDGGELTRTVHTLVARAFLGERPLGMQVDHLDCNKRNNRPSNLQYVTAAENSRRAASNGLSASGLRHGRQTKPHRTARGESVNTAKLTAADVVEMRRLHSAGWNLTRLMDRFGLSKSATHSIVTRKNWAHV